jgi:drug/metabolite transporter (DMT)-like permease
VEAYTDQIQLLRNRAELIRRAFMFALAALTGTLLSCLLLGLGLYSIVAAEAAAIVFVLSMISLLVCVAFYFREVSAALRAVQEEANDLLSADKPYLLPFIGRSR